MTDDGGTADAAPNVHIPPGIQLYGVDQEADAQLLLALGAVVRASSQMELILRTVFCQLEAGPQAAVVAARQGVEWLLDMNAALADHRDDVTDEQRAELANLIRQARKATQGRNRLVHSAWVGADGGPMLVQTQRRVAAMSGRPVTLQAVVAVAHALDSCTRDLVDWMMRAVPPDRGAVPEVVDDEHGASRNLRRHDGTNEADHVGSATNDAP
jgi:hypothetical protein